MPMQFFPVPNQKNLVEAVIEPPNMRGKRSPSRSDVIKGYQELDSQASGTMRFTNDMSNPRSIGDRAVNIVRPGVHDEVRGMKIIGGMSCKYGGGRQELSLLLVRPGGRYPMPGRSADFYVMKVPSHGRWNVAQEFTFSKREYDMVSDLLPVFCDPGYEGSRTVGLASVQRNYGIPHQGVTPIAGSDSDAIKRMGTDRGGQPNIVADTLRDRRPGVYTAKEILYGDEEEYYRERYGEYESDEYGSDYGTEDYGTDDYKDDADDYGHRSDYDNEGQEPTDRRKDQGTPRKRDKFRRNAGKANGQSQPFDWERPFGDEDATDDSEYDEYDPYADPYASNDGFAIDPDVMSAWESRQGRPQSSDIKVLLIVALAVLAVLVIGVYLIFRFLLS